MSISKGAFGRSAKGGFIESAKGARGWASLFSLIVGGFNSAGGNNLFRLNPDTGETIWGATIGTSAAINNIKHGPTGRLYVHTDEAGDRVREIDPETGSVLATSGTVFFLTMDVDTNGKIYACRTADADVVRLADDLTTVEANCNSGNTSGVSVDGDGNIYVGNATSGGTLLEKFNSSGTLVTSSATNASGYSVFAPAGDYVYVIGTAGGDTPVYKLSKSTLAVLDSFLLGETANTLQPQCWATDGTHIYTSRSGLAAGLPSYTVKIKVSDMTEVSRFTTSTASPITTRTGGVSKSGSNYVTVSGRTNEWDGNDGTYKSVWALDSSMNLVWSADPSSTFGATAVSGSFTRR